MTASSFQPVLRDDQWVPRADDPLNLAVGPGLRRDDGLLYCFKSLQGYGLPNFMRLPCRTRRAKAFRVPITRFCRQTDKDPSRGSFHTAVCAPGTCNARARSASDAHAARTSQAPP